MSNKPIRTATRTPGVTKLTYDTGLVSFECRLTYTDHTTGKREPLRPEDGPFRRYEDAKEWMRDAREKLAHGVVVPTRKRSGMTITDAIASFIDMRMEKVRNKDLAEDTVGKDRDNLLYLPRAFPLNPAIGSLKVQDFRAVQDRGVAGDFGRPWSDGTYNQVISIHHLLMDHMVNIKEVSTNVARTIPRRKVVKALQYKPQTWTADEMRLALDKAMEYRHGIAFWLGLSGFRLGEIAGLRETDIDFAGLNIVICNTRRYNRYAGKVGNKLPKNNKIRDYPLNPELAAALRLAIARKREDRLALGAEYVETGFLLTREDGKPYEPKSIGKEWPKFCKRLGLPVIRLHDARHTFGTIMAGLPQEVVPPQELSRLLGHSRTSYTMDTYVHSQPERLKAASAAYGRLISGSQAS